MKGSFMRALALTCVIALIAATPAAAWTPKPVAQDPLPNMPGSQPGQSGTASGPDRCDNCHGGYDAAVEPGGNWRGSMMAQAYRDPLFLACLVVANQDSIWALGNPNAADICIRCHSPAGWLEGRSDPTNGSRLSGVDLDGVQCDYCHRNLDPIAQNGQLTAANGSPDVPAEAVGSIGAQMAAQTQLADLTYLRTLTLFDGSPFLAANSLPQYYGAFPAWQEPGGGQHFNDSANIMRGPFTDAVARHQLLYSRWHKSKEFCHSCHDVSNPILQNLEMALGSSKLSAASYYHVERTSSEYLNGAIGAAAAPIPVNIPGVGQANKCQDCHMRDITGKGCNKADAPTRTDLPLHDLTGGNSWITGILASADPNNVTLYDAYNNAILSGAKYPGAKVDMSGIIGWGTKLQAGKERAIQQIKYGSTLSEIASSTSQVTLRIRNNSAHKLISGYPEGRRLFLNVKWYDSNGSELPAAEINPYAPLVTTKDAAGNEIYVSGGDITSKTEELVFEAEMQSSLTGEPESTFHFALGTSRWKDNRIPPAGFDTTRMAERKVDPVWHGEPAPTMFTPAEYAGGYKDVALTKPAGAASYKATLYYQTTSKKYVEFLRDEINGTATSLTSPGKGGDPAYLAQTDPFFANIKDWGRALWDLWLHNGGCAPVVMQQIGGPPTPPPATITVNPPTILTATAGKGSVALAWTAPTGGTPATGYRIWVWSAGKYTYIGQSTTTTFTHSKLRAGTTYTYAVTATAVVNGTTYESGYSNQASATVR